MEDKLLEQLVEILEEQYELYQKIYRLAEEKKETIINNEVEELSRLVKDEEEIISEVEEREQKRKQVIGELCQIYRIEEHELTFNRLLDRVSEDWQQQIAPLRDKLLATINDLSQQNHQNKELIEEAMKLNKFNYNLLMKVVNAADQTYGEKGEKKDKSVKHIIDRRG